MAEAHRGGRGAPPAAVAALAGLALLGFAFGGCLGGRFVWDDVMLVRDNGALYRSGGAAAILTHDLWGQATGVPSQLYHPVPMLTLWLQGILHGPQVAGFRLANVLLHALVGLALTAVLRRLRAPFALAAGCGLLLLVHPLVTEPVMWITGRHDLLGTLFTVLALLAWPAGAPPAAKAPRARGLLSVGCCALAFLSKEPYVIAPALVMLLAIAEARLAAEQTAPSGWWAWVLPGVTWAGPALGFAVRGLLGISAGAAQLGVSPAQHAQNLSSIAGHYAALAVGFASAPTFALLQPPDAADAATTIGLLAIGLLALIHGVRHRSAGWLRVAFGLATFFVALAPHLISVPTIGFYGNRYGYLPLVGLLVALSGLLQPAHALLLRRGSRAMHAAMLALAACALLISAAATATVSATWRTPESLYTAAVESDPHNGIAWYHLGHARRTDEGCERALPLFVKAWQLRPDYARAPHNVAGCLLELRRPRDALAPARAALELEAGAGRHYNVAAALAGVGRLDEAHEHLSRALALDPEHVAARRLLDQIGQVRTGARPDLTANDAQVAP